LEYLSFFHREYNKIGICDDVIIMYALLSDT